MPTIPQRFFVLGLFAFLAVIVMPISSAADAIRLTVAFSVIGDVQFDPVDGSSTASGSFSLITNVPPGKRSVDVDGFNADAVSFSWAGKSWTADDADVTFVSFAADGSLNGFALTGFLPGERRAEMSSEFWPDIGVAFCGLCPNEPDLRRPFSYTTSSSPGNRIFTGQLTSFTATQTNVVPEPMSLLLVGTGLVCIGARTRFRRKLMR